MVIVVTVVHVLACVVLVLVVLLQAGKGADIGAVFGGGSSTTIFGSSGAGNFLTRLTTGAAVVFMVTSLTLTYGPTTRGTATIMPETVGTEGETPADIIPEEGALAPDAATGEAEDGGVVAAPDAAPDAAAEGAPAAGDEAAPAGEAAPAAEAPAAAAPDAGDAPAGEAGGGIEPGEPPAVPPAP